MICHKDEVYERDYGYDEKENSDIAYDLFYSRDRRKVYKKVRTKFSMFYIIEREAHILTHLWEKGENRIPTLIDKGPDFIITTYVGERIDTTVNDIIYTRNINETQRDQILNVRKSIYNLGVKFSNDNDEHFRSLLGEVKMDNFGWAYLYKKSDNNNDFNDFIDHVEEENVEIDGEQHLVVDWYQSLEEKYFRQALKSSGLLYRFSMEVATLPLSEKVSIMSKFYNHLHVDDERGTRPFKVYFVTDPSPKYEYRKTTHGTSLVNTKMYESKLTLRRILKGLFGHTDIHATDNEMETQQNLLALGLFGYYRFKYFVSFNDVFAELNADYYQTTSWYTLITDPDYMINYLDEPGHDIDLLVTSLGNTKKILGGISHEDDNVLVRAGSHLIMFDIKCIDSQYFSRSHSIYLLENSFLHQASGAIVPKPIDFAYSKLYHHLLHGRGITERMLDLFVRHGIWNTKMTEENTYDKLFGKMEEYLRSRGLQVFDGLKFPLRSVCDAAYPKTSSTWDPKVPWYLTAISMALSDINVTNPSLVPDLSLDYVDFMNGQKAPKMLLKHVQTNTGRMFTLKIRLSLKNHPEEGFDYSLAECIQLFYIHNKQMSLLMKNDELSKVSVYGAPRLPIAVHLFPHGKDTRVCVAEYIEGISIERHMVNITTKLEVADFVLAMADVLYVLQQNNIVHRDINVRNLIIHQDGSTGLFRITLIDFSWASSPIFKMMNDPPYHLNMGFLTNKTFDVVAHEDEYHVIQTTIELLALYSSARLDWLLPYLHQLHDVKLGNTVEGMYNLANQLARDSTREEEENDEDDFIQRNQDVRKQICQSYETDILRIEDEKGSLTFKRNRRGYDMEEGYQIVNSENDSGHMQNSIHPFGEKYTRLENFFVDFMLSCARDKTVLEVGHHMGYFSFLSILVGAASVSSYSTMENYVPFVEDVVTTRFASTKTKVNVGSAKDIYHAERADIVVAINFVYWFYQCSEQHHGSLSRAIGYIAQKTRKFLIIEWVQPVDETSPDFQYLLDSNEYYTKRYNSSIDTLHVRTRLYMHEVFQLTLIKIFGPENVYNMGVTSANTIVYVCTRETHFGEGDSMTYDYSDIDDYDMKHLYTRYGSADLWSALRKYKID